MKSALTKWVFGIAFGLIVIAVGISITTDQTWADSCTGTTIRHGAADCLDADFRESKRTLFLTNECPDLGVVTAEVKVINYGSEGTVFSLQALSTSETLIETIVNDDDAIYTNARCCPTSGICDITDCDTTDGVINDTSHTTHCRLIDDSTGRIIRAAGEGAEITNGTVTFPERSSDDDRS